MNSDEPAVLSFIYYGFSMTGVFRPGDDLFAKNCMFNYLQPGDIIAFTNPADGRYIVHRVIAVYSDYVTTQGDNNPHSDVSPVTPEQNVRQVIGFARNGKLYNITRGHAGMREFRHHQFMRRAKLRAKKILAPFIRVTPLRAFHPMLPPLEKHSFSDQEFVYSGQKIVAKRCTKTKRWRIQSVFYRLFFCEQTLIKRFDTPIMTMETPQNGGHNG